MKLVQCRALRNVMTDAGFFRQGALFKTTLSDAIRLGNAVEKCVVQDEPDLPPPYPPKAGTAAYDEPPQNRMMRREKFRLHSDD